MVRSAAVKTYTIDDPVEGLITYTDNKRHLWPVAVLFPLIPFIGMGLMAGAVIMILCGGLVIQKIIKIDI